MKIILSILILCLSTTAWADVGFQFAAPGVRSPDDPNVSGVRVTFIQGKNETMRGADFGIGVSQSTELNGLRAVAGVGHLTGNSRGLAASFVNIHEGSDRGVNAAILNTVNNVKGGANVGVVNLVGDFSMVDIGALNSSNSSRVQVGVVNMTKRIDTVQIGLLNFAENGFLPFFPFFNFPKP